MLAEGPALQSARGRPRTHLRIQQDAAYAISIALLIDGFARIAIVDLHGSRVHTSIGEMPRLTPAVELPAVISRLVHNCLDGAPSLRANIKIAAIVIPAQTDQINGVVHWLPGMAQSLSLQLKEILEQEIGLPVIVEDPATIIARAEYWFGPAEHSDSFSLVASVNVV